MSVNGAGARTKGANAERALVAWLRDHGHPDARRYLAGDGRQPGDIDGLPGLVLDVKHRRQIDISAGLRDVQRQTKPGQTGLLVVRPNGITNPGDWWAVQTLADWMNVWEDR